MGSKLDSCAGDNVLVAVYPNSKIRNIGDASFIGSVSAIVLALAAYPFFVLLSLQRSTSDSTHRTTIRIPDFAQSIRCDWK